jgi:hypothetical protein
MRIAPRTPVRCTVSGGLPIYGRALRDDCPAGLVRIRLTADHSRGRKGECVYVLAKNARPHWRGASRSKQAPPGQSVMVKSE